MRLAQLTHALHVLTNSSAFIIQVAGAASAESSNTETVAETLQGTKTSHT
jgi:hypothetical protein